MEEEAHQRERRRARVMVIVHWRVFPLFFSSDDVMYIPFLCVFPSIRLSHNNKPNSPIQLLLPLHHIFACVFDLWRLGRSVSLLPDLFIFFRPAPIRGL